MASVARAIEPCSLADCLALPLGVLTERALWWERYDAVPVEKSRWTWAARSGVESRMITRVEADGFKSLRRFAVDLEPLTVILGANATGKSNLFDVLQILSRLATTDVTTALASGRGSRRDQFSRTADDAVFVMTLAL
jgi:putative ribosome biogenesis GTPase RsgA